MIDKQLNHNEINNSKRQFPFAIVAQDLQHPENVGMLFRISEAMGVKEIVLVGKTPSLPHKKISKTSRSTEKTMQWQYFHSIDEALNYLRAENYSLLGIEITQKSIPIRDYNFKKHKKVALVLGAESKGISSKTLTQLEACVHIPMFGLNTSMNVISALGITLYEVTSQILSN